MRRYSVLSGFRERRLRVSHEWMESRVDLRIARLLAESLPEKEM